MSDEAAIPENVPIVESAPLRENLIATAIKFLQNPKVQGSPLNQRKEFLQRKGLTEEEIQAAVDRSGATDVLPSSAPVPSGALPPVPGLQVVPQQEVSTWAKIRDYSALAIIVGGIVYGLYSLFKRYIEPIFIKRHEKMDKKLSQLEEGIGDINSGMKKNMQELQTCIGELRQQLTEQTIKMNQVSNNLSIYKAETSMSGVSNSAIGELQAEITSVKGLLLSTKQFPAAPVNPPVIPSWQMKSSAPQPGSEVTPDTPSTPLSSNDNEIRKEDEPTQNGLSANCGSTPQKRIDLEENGDSVGNNSGDATPVLNGHSSDPENGGSVGNSLHSPMLTSPGKLSAAALKSPSSNEANPPVVVGGESELD